MKIIKYIAVFTPEPWQGYGYDVDSVKILRQGNIRGREINWGDTHHPGLSEVDGKYTSQTNRSRARQVSTRSQSGNASLTGDPLVDGFLK